MNEEYQQGVTSSAPYPDPPPFYTHFTPANVAHVAKLRDEAADLSSSELPHELQFLVPPPPPSDGNYRSFGGDFDVRMQVVTKNWKKLRV